MNLSLRNIDLPKSFVDRMISIGLKTSKVYKYMYNVTNSFFEKNEISLIDDSVSSIRFIMSHDQVTKKTLFDIYLVKKPERKGRKQELIPFCRDNDGTIKNRLQTYTKVKTDFDFAHMLIYMYCKTKNIYYNIIGDELYQDRVIQDKSMEKSVLTNTITIHLLDSED